MARKYDQNHCPYRFARSLDFARDDGTLDSGVKTLSFLYRGEFAVFELGGRQAGAAASGDRGDFGRGDVLGGNQAGDCPRLQNNNAVEFSMESGNGQRRGEFRGGNYPVDGEWNVGEIKGI